MTSSLSPGATDTSMAITGSTLLFPVVGHPIAQVKAPMAFNALFERAGVDARVVPLDLSPDTVVDTCRALLASRSIGGLLVTVPYKKTLFALLDDPGATAQVVGACNAIRRTADGRIAGDLFDGTGFLAGLRAGGHEPAGRRVLVLGAGGAGSAVAAALALAGTAWIGLFDPNLDLAAALAARLQPRFPNCAFVPMRAPDGAACDIVVNATPLGMKPGDALPIDPATLAAGTLVVDVIMQPAVTPLLRLAAERGHPTHPGRPMLDHQMPAYLDFFGLPMVAALAAADLRDRAAADAHAA